MPILDVEIVMAEKEPPTENLAKRLADAAGEIFGSGKGQTWVKVRELSAKYYAENGISDQWVYPVFVTVLKRKYPEKEEIKKEVEKLTQMVAKICQRPAENVHVFYLPEGTGRVSFGGKPVE